MREVILHCGESLTLADGTVIRAGDSVSRRVSVADAVRALGLTLDDIELDDFGCSYRIKDVRLTTGVQGGT